MVRLGRQLVENKLVVADPAGDIVLEHVKYGGNMLEGSLLGDGVLRTIETPYGTLSGIICWDTDFPSIVRQAGRNGTDILLSPAHDWREIDPIHAQMAVFRAIENGISVVRQADQGRSITADPYGRVLAEMDHFTASERVMVAQVPTNGVFTVYPVIGDLFGWLSVVGFVVVAIWAVVRGPKAARTAPPQPEGQKDAFHQDCVFGQGMIRLRRLGLWDSQRTGIEHPGKGKWSRHLSAVLRTFHS